MAVIPTGFAQANFRYSGSGAPNGAEWTLGLEHAGSGLTPVEVAEGLFDNYVATIATVMPASCILSSVLVKFGPNDLGPSAEFTGSGGGTGGGTQASPNVAILVSKQTAIGGRPGRGRFYLPGAQESEVDQGGNLTPAFVSGLQDEVDDFLSQLGILGTPPVLLHSETSPLSVPTPITACVVSSVVATQRRRQRR